MATFAPFAQRCQISCPRNRPRACAAGEMFVVSWQHHHEVLAEVGWLRCARCLNRARHFVVKMKRGVKLMFVPVYRGSGGHATVCEICDHIAQISDADARLLLLRHLGPEDSRLHVSPHLQSSDARVRVAREMLSYAASNVVDEHVAALRTQHDNLESMRVKVLHCIAWHLHQSLPCPMEDAEVIVYEDVFVAEFYVDPDTDRVLVDMADLDAKIAHVARQAATSKS